MEQFIKTIFTHLPVGILVIGADGRIVEANPASCTILGCPVSGFVGNSWGDIFLSQENNLEFTEVVLDAIQKETPRIQRTAPYFGPDGSKKYLSVISSAQRENGKIQAIVVLIEDLTELHHMHEREKDFLEQNHKLAQQRADSLISFARSVAHQIRNPITSIAGFSRLLTRHATEEQREPLEAIREETGKLEVMVRAVAEYSSLTVNAQVLVNLWVVIQDARHRIEDHPAVTRRDVTWNTDCPDISILADRDLMAQAVSEILLNGIEFGGPTPEITISASEINGHVVIIVEDTGPGFTAEGLDLGLDPFYTTKTVGAGMGLTRAKRIIDEHQGGMEIGNTEAGGGRVTITLPKSPI